jgi:hypothetical protein
MEKFVWVPHLPTRWDAVTQAQVPSIDLNDATRYGEIKTLADANTPRDQIATSLPSLIQDVEKGDFILCVGDVAICATTIAHLLVRDGSVSLLRWDRPNKQYAVEHIKLQN